jgi:antirestriction protein ArdC
MNVWALAFSGYSSRGWATFKQAIKLGLVVRKDEKGTPIYFMKKFEKRQTAAERAAKKRPESFFMARLSYVFNLDQFADLPGKEGTRDRIAAKLVATVSTFTPEASAEQIVKRSGARISLGSDRACYVPILDRIEMPNPTQFTDGAAGYYPVLFHELSHWTGHASRLARDLSGRFGSKDYALEELVAELSAAFLAHTVGYDHTSRSAAYLANWLTALTDRPDAFVSAASAAQKSADFLLGDVAEKDDAASDDEDEAAPRALAVA